MSVIPALELDDEVPAGGCASDAESAHRRLRAAVHEPDPLHRWHALANQLGQADLARAGDTERAARLGRALDRIDHPSIGVTEQERAERPDIVDVTAPIRVPDKRPVAA